MISFTTEKGIPVALWSAPSRSGGRCYWNTYGKRGDFGGACNPPSLLLPPNAIVVGRSQGAGKGREVLLWGQVGADVASLELRFQDGDRVRIVPFGRLVLYGIPSRRYRRGHRLNLILALNARGEIIKRQREPTDTPGSYPCESPKRSGPRVNGELVYACP